MDTNIVVTPQNELRRIIADEISNALASAKPTEKEATEKEIYTTKEAMHYLGVSRSTLQRWRKDGTIPFRKINGSIRYTKQDLDSLLEAAAK